MLTPAYENRIKSLERKVWALGIMTLCHAALIVLIMVAIVKGSVR